MALSPPPATARPAPPPPKRNGTHAPAPAATADAPTSGRFTVSTGRVTAPQKVMIYGTGGVGKSTLASLAPKPVFLDIEQSTNRLDVARVDGIRSWADLRACLQSNALDDYKTVVVDSVTKGEELATAHTIETVKHEKGHKVDSLLGYGFGKGAGHLFDTYLHLLVDLDRHVRAGRNVVLIAHACTTEAPNPDGEDFLQFQPRLQHPKKGENSIRNRTFEWCDHVLFIGYDVLSADRKGQGGGTRTIFTKEVPSHLAKVRELDESIEPRPYENATDGAIWPLLLGGAS